MLSAQLLGILRTYWRLARPQHWLLAQRVRFIFAALGDLFTLQIYAAKERRMISKRTKVGPSGRQGTRR
jgi:hypothetical protein